MSTTGTYRSWIPNSFHVMVKPRGSICNLNCTYCYFLSKEKMYPDSSFTMPDELLENYTRQYIQAQHMQQVIFAWQGMGKVVRSTSAKGHLQRPISNTAASPWRSFCK